MANTENNSKALSMAPTRAIGSSRSDLSDLEKKFFKRIAQYRLPEATKTEALENFRAKDLWSYAKLALSSSVIDDGNGTVSSRFSGHTISFEAGGRAQALKELQTHDAKIKREMLLAMLELSTTSPEVIASIYKNNPPIGPDGKPQPIDDAYLDFIAKKVEPYLRADLANLTESDLQKWASDFPGSNGIASLLTSHQNKLEYLKTVIKSELPPGLNGRELDELVAEHSDYAWLRESAEFNDKPSSVFNVLNLKNDLADIRDSLKVIGAHLFTDKKGVFKEGIAENFQREYGWPYNSFNFLS